MNPTPLDAILALVPGAEVTLPGDGSVVWHRPPTPPVSDAQIADRLASLQAAAAWDDVRAWRAQLLSATDKIRQQIARQAAGATPLHPIDAATAAAWQSWTQALADIPEAYPSPADVIWPAPPATPSVTWPVFPAGIGTLGAGWPLI